jgi:predicted SnoaL-like aldol condensation-catalyzing enzyme
MRNILALVALIILTSCNNKKSESMPSTENEELVKQYFDYFNKHQWKEMAEMYTDTAEFKDPSLGQGIVKQSRQQIIAKYTELSKMFPDVHDEVVKVYPSGESHIIVEFISSGTEPDNSKFELPICTIFTIEDQKITKDFTYYDNFEDPETDSN